MAKSFFGHVAVKSPSSALLVAVLALAVACASGPAVAQDRGGKRIYDEQLRVRLDEQDPERDRIGFNAGGWGTFALFNFDDDAGRKHTLRQYELRLWGSLNINGVHQFYVRGMAGYDDWNAGDNPKSYHRDEDIDPRIERAWYKLRLGRWLSGQGGAIKPPVDVNFKVGREFADIGTALVLSTPLDMVQFEIDVGDWQFMALLGKTIDWVSNIDASADIVGHQERCIWGFEVTYTGLDQHRPFAYFLGNNDHSSPTPHTAGQDYDYSSRYVGVGSEGSLFVPRLRYQVEVVGEWGKTYSDGVVSGRDDIRAMAADVLLEYFFEAKTRPKLSMEYIFGSGDSDRSTSSVATVGGNREGTTDRAFNGLGFRDTGIAFAPAISNLHIYIIGASFFPLEDHKLFDKMEVGSKTYFYHKDKSGGPISDSSANTREQWVGWEWDVFCNWRVSSDLIWSIRYGAFQPGAAFDRQDCRQFLYASLTYSF